MHVHILGICGTFMGGVAAIAKAAGHRVTGSDKNVYPPMSTQLEALGIELIQGFDAAQLKPRPDVVLVGNVMTRGVPVIEALLDSGIPYSSGSNPHSWKSQDRSSGSDSASMPRSSATISRNRRVWSPTTPSRSTPRMNWLASRRTNCPAIGPQSARRAPRT